MARRRPSDSGARPLLPDVGGGVSIALAHGAEKPIEAAVSGVRVHPCKVRSQMPAHDAQRRGRERRVTPHDEIAGLGDRLDERRLRSLDDPADTTEVIVEERLSRREHRLRRMTRRITLEPRPAREPAPIKMLVHPQHG